MQLSFPQFAYGRQDYGLAETRLVNLFLEATPGGPTNDARIQRPGMAANYLVGNGPIWGLYQQPGVFGGDRFTLSGDQVYRERNLLGAALSNRAARWAASKTQLVLVTGGKAYCYDGTALAQITDPDLPAVSDVVYLSGRFYYLQQDSDIWWYSAINDATSIDGLAFATAESAPDANVGACVLADEVWFFGQKTVEPWYQTGDANNPLQRSQGRKYDRGCAAQQSIMLMDNTIIWVGDDRVVYRAGTVPTRISNHGVEARLRKCTSIADLTALRIEVDGHAFYVINIPGQGSFAYDLSTGANGTGWAEWTSYGQPTFRARSAVMIDGFAYLGDAITGQIWQMDPAVNQDGADPMERLVSCNVLQPGGLMRCDNISLQCSRGVGLENDTDPQVQMRYSDDGARTFTDWHARSLGKIGDYLQRPIWRRQGLMQAPGRCFEFRVTDPVSVVFSGVQINQDRP